jgi:hypothetical protein
VDPETMSDEERYIRAVEIDITISEGSWNIICVEEMPISVFHSGINRNARG